MARGGYDTLGSATQGPSPPPPHTHLGRLGKLNTLLDLGDEFGHHGLEGGLLVISHVPQAHHRLHTCTARGAQQAVAVGGRAGGRAGRQQTVAVGGRADGQQTVAERAEWAGRQQMGSEVCLPRAWSSRAAGVHHGGFCTALNGGRVVVRP